MARPAPKTGNTFVQYRVLYEGQELGVWSDPEHSAARELIARGLASRDDTLLTHRDGIPSMRGGMGWYAGTYASEGERASPFIGKWRPFPVHAKVKGSPLNDQDGE